ncbi:mechanosensitive ion channel family protein [Gracilimonas mengyeensis]|uniref:Small conductance mechanosensitive channel n=1 Tax=Gracilimonas mengyeensis TaxID=1302730 RepID=A0A521BRG1_9BACT|nr:mechanosensitive ion channel domain-containing protein [Gracilimonas mengyeensis]SMO49703.1 small conductance mechanosensitive channel [Gracilimonas mengyeensis]
MDSFTISSEELMGFVMEFGPKLLAAIATLVIGLWIVKILVKGAVRVLNRSNVDDALVAFLKSLISILLKVLVYITALGMLGVQMTSFIAILGAAGLAVGLALQGSLSNFAGGVLILFFKPFEVGNFIERGSESGTVEKIDILHTTIRTPNNQVIIVPNGQLANSPVTNYSRKETRRAVFSVGVSYDSDVKQAREVILNVLNSDERTLPDPEPVVVLTNLGDSSLDLSVRSWTKTEDYWSYFWENLEKIKEELDNNDIEMPFPQRDVHLHKEE